MCYFVTNQLTADKGYGKSVMVRMILAPSTAVERPPRDRTTLLRLIVALDAFDLAA